MTNIDKLLYIDQNQIHVVKKPTYVPYITSPEARIAIVKKRSRRKLRIKAFQKKYGINIRYDDVDDNVIKRVIGQLSRLIGQSMLT